ncbi:MAG: Re/Si-specific NAD(P)(+) transhydrogenase subunit alpha [Spirochaetales bacterium]|nr:Re/Si-specific NAD(P)(+) transhydrogenase subunit alpha [Spirochaetales bacterium]
MIIAVPAEVEPGENRVAIVPETVGKLSKLGFQIHVESGAGSKAGFVDEAYKSEGARLLSTQDLYATADVLLKINPPGKRTSKHEFDLLPSGAVVISFFYSLYNWELARKAAEKGIEIISMDAIPRITRAQRMDALSSQSNLAGYKAVLLAANAIPRLMPLLMTAAGTIAPARVVVMGAGVAGLQAIATARRLGAVVDVSDVRPAVKEEVESLGARFIELPVQENLAGEGGYAKEASADFLKKQKETLMKYIAEADAVITTALVPGKKAPVLLSKEMVSAMRPGSVVVDIAAGFGGNCELTQAGQTIQKNGVTIIGETNLPSLLAYNASELYARNQLALIKEFTKEKQFIINQDDEIMQGALIVHKGSIVHAATRKAAGLE